ncbi:MAG: DNA-3-methyladenine glycosylase I [Alphaproteobacteria bacterium]|nr:DNA-3-methyladenine glycosylase I [Alphaproteobacteria bacterium]
MTPFSTIEAKAAKRHGGPKALEALLHKPKTASALKRVPDDRYLSQLSLRVFQAGLKHSMVEAKWPIFEEVFFGFEPKRVRAMSDEAIEALMKDVRLIRHLGKLRATRDNAAALCELSAAHGGFGAYLASFPPERTIELWDDLTKRFKHLGGASGPYFLRQVGKDVFLPTEDVAKALKAYARHDGGFSGKAARQKAQAIICAYATERGRPLCQVSRILALAVG